MGLKTIISLNFTLTGDAALLYSTLKSCSWKIDMHASLDHVHATDTTTCGHGDFPPSRFPLSVTSYDMHVHPTAASAYSPSEIPVSIHHYPKAQYIGSCPAQVLYWHTTFHVHQAFHGYHHIIIQPCHTSVQPSYAVARQPPTEQHVVSSQESPADHTSSMPRLLHHANKLDRSLPVQVYFQTLPAHRIAGLPLPNQPVASVKGATAKSMQAIPLLQGDLDQLIEITHSPTCA